MSENMKDSGIEWVGEIPENWEVMPLKYCVTQNKAVLLENTPATYLIRYVDIGSVSFETGISNYQKMLFENSPSRARRKVRCGDIIISTVRTYLKAIARIKEDERVIVSTGFAVLSPNNICSMYLEYFCKSDVFCEEIEKRSYGIAYPAINSFDMGNILIFVPPLSEQQAIADFLDTECAKIDDIISIMEQQVKILNKYKKSLITETVTKGLDKSVPMKDSGIEWIGKIPEGWKVSKIKFLFCVINGSTPESGVLEFWDGNINWITPADMKETGKISNGKRNITESGYYSCGTTILAPNSIVVSSRAPIGKINITTDFLCTNQGCKSLVSKSNINKYFYYLLIAGKKRLVDLGRGTTFLELGTYDLKNYSIVIPPIDEQKTIADYLDTECAKIDSILSDKQKAIDTIKSYKKSLIYEYVTGKKRVFMDSNKEAV